MKTETRVEVVVLLIGAVIVGSWVGLKIARKPAGTPETPAALAQPPAGVPATRAMTAPPAEPPAAKVEAPTPRPAVVPRSETPRPAAVARPAQPKPAAAEAPKPPSAQPAPPTAAQELAGKVAGAADPAIEKAAAMMDEGKKYEARAVLTELLFAAPDGPARDRIKALLDKINQELFFSRAPSPDCRYYTIERGDSLSGIANQMGRDYYFHSLIMQINGIRDAKRIQVNQKIKIPVGKFSAVVDRSSRRLTVLLNGHYIKEYAVGLGAPNSPTPLGVFLVANNKQVNPDWTSPDGQVYKHGDPRNILGTRWIGFQETDLHRGYGIHGTNDETTIGKDVSNGCVRMLKQDVEELFTMLQPGDEVKVVE